MLDLKKHACLVLASALALAATVDLPAAQAVGTLPVPQAVSAPLDEVNLLGGLEAYDDRVLGDRTPLILVHGIGGTESRYYHWENFLKAVKKNPAFQERYKIYFYRYDSSGSVPHLSEDLKYELKGFIGSLKGRKIRVLGYSEGGLLVRNALEDDYVDAHTLSVITIATPFHGSPLANPEWIKQQLAQERGVSLVEVGHQIAYDIAGKKFPTFRQDFRWDNFDQSMPVSLAGKPFVDVDYALEQKDNFITYGSYFGDDVDPERTLPEALGVQVKLPKEEAKFGNLFKKNFLFSLIRNNISRLPLARHADEQPDQQEETPDFSDVVQAGEIQLDDVTASRTMVASQDEAYTMTAFTQPHQEALVASRGVLPVASVAGLAAPAEDEPSQTFGSMMPMMVFNDGISPISSTLWLGRYTPKFESIPNPVDRVWAALKSLKGTNKARLFAGLDHRNWMDGTTRTQEDKVLDLLHPEEPPKTVFEWIIFDLLREPV